MSSFNNHSLNVGVKQRAPLRIGYHFQSDCLAISRALRVGCPEIWDISDGPQWEVVVANDPNSWK